MAKSSRPPAGPRPPVDAATASVVALRAAIRAVIRRIPRGRVVTYGQVADLAGCPGAARLVAATLKTTPPATRLPWQRVIGRKARATGRIAILDPVGGAMQRALLEGEGVAVSERGHVSLADHGWLPVGSPRR